MSSRSTPEGILSALGLPSELLVLLSQVCFRNCPLLLLARLTPFQMGIDINDLVSEAEYNYIEQLMEYAQGLPDAIRQPVNVKDHSAFASFLGDASKSYFNKCAQLTSAPNLNA
jgi:hypothetical protein